MRFLIVITLVIIVIVIVIIVIVIVIIFMTINGVCEGVGLTGVRPQTQVEQREAVQLVRGERQRRVLHVVMRVHLLVHTACVSTHRDKNRGKKRTKDRRGKQS